MHSHNYTAEQAFRRAFGDARAMAATYDGKAEDFSWFRTVALGFLSDWTKDVRWCNRHRRLGETVEAAKVRWMQRRGRLAGFRQGWTDYQRDAR
jgi:rhamnosyltransferase